MDNNVHYIENLIPTDQRFNCDMVSPDNGLH